MKQSFNPIDFVPKNLQSGLAVSNDKLYVSSALRNESFVFELFNTFKTRKIISEHKFLEPDEFNKIFGRNTLATAELSNELQIYVKSLLETAYEQKASDIHIYDMGTHGLIRFRIHGILIDHDKLEAERCRAVITGIYNSMTDNSDTGFILIERQDAVIINNDFLPRGIESCRLHLEPTRKKNSPQGIGTCLFIRLFYDIIEAKGTLEERLSKLGFLESQIQTMKYLTTRTGGSLLSGSTGHGKSTVSKHVIGSMYEAAPHKHYMSVEDPPEYYLQGVNQIAVSTKDKDIKTAYIEAIAGAMRSDPDCLFIGEIRYAEAVFAIVHIGNTGHAAWTTIHASNAINIIERMEIMLEEKGIQNAKRILCNPTILAGLEYQRLIPMLCPHCSKKLHDVIDSYDKTMAERINRALKTEDDEVRIQGSGCEHCGYTGFIGQQIAAEVIATDETFLNYMLKDNKSKAKEYWIKEKGGITHVQHALKYVKEGKADPFITEDRLGLPLDFEVCL